MRGLKPLCFRSHGRQKRRIFYRCVDWNTVAEELHPVMERRIFYRCVDWNLYVGFASYFSPVASFTDAWIETHQHSWIAHFIRSHLLQMRGLKLPGYAGAVHLCESHLLQMRGLKREVVTTPRRCICRIFYRCVDWNWWTLRTVCRPSRSHLLQMRGLKPVLKSVISGVAVASFTDAWIETGCLTCR